MKIRKWIALGLVGLALSQPALAEKTLKTLIAAIELSPSNIIMPQTTNGTMTYKPCFDDCDAEYERARLTADTRYSIEGNAVKFEDFRQEFSAIRSVDESYALVSVDTENNTVTSIDIAR